MNTPAPAGQTPAEQPAPAHSGVEESLHTFWEKNRSTILVLCAVAVLVVLGREGWHYYTAQKEAGVRAEYARAADRPEQLAAFAKAHDGHPLAGVAYLRIADQRYSASDHRRALENYEKAASLLKNPVLLARAKLGVAMSQLNSGNQSAAEATLKAVSTDASLAKELRAEAVYHLAALAKEAGNTTEVDRLVAEIGKIDPAGVWSQRATSLVVSRPAL